MVTGKRNKSERRKQTGTEYRYKEEGFATCKASFPSSRLARKERRRSKAFGRRLPQRRFEEVGRVGRHGVAPPGAIGPGRQQVRLGEDEAEEDEDGADARTGVEGRRQHVVEPGPGGPAASPPDNVRQGSDDDPGTVVDARGRRDVASTGEDDGPVDVAQPALGVSAGEEPSRDGHNGTDEEEVEDCVVLVSSAEVELGTDETPDDTGRAEDGGARADEVVGCVVRADAVDVAQGPKLDGNENKGGDDSGDELSHEDAAGWHLHVVTELLVRKERDALVHGDVAPGLEQHHGHGLSWPGVSDDELGNDVETNFKVADGVDHSDWDDVDGSDQQSQEQGPNGQLCWPHLDGDNTHDQGGDESTCIPPPRDLAVRLHEASMDVWLIFEGSPHLTPDVLTGVEGDVDQSGCHRGEGQTVGDGEDWAEVLSAVIVVSSGVEGALVGDDARDVVLLAKAVVDATCRHREVFGEANVGVVHSRGADPVEDDETCEDVELGEEGRNQRRGTKVVDLGPVERQERHSQSLRNAEELVDDDVVGHNPAHPVESAQGGEDVAWEEVPDKGCQESVEEEALSRHLACSRCLLVVQSREKGAVRQHRRPDHGSGPDDERPAETRETEADELRGECHEDVVSKAPHLIVVELLNQEDVGGVCSLINYSCHDTDHCVFLDVKGSWVEGPATEWSSKDLGGQNFLEELAERIAHELNDESRNRHGRVSEVQELVETTEEDDEDHA